MGGRCDRNFDYYKISKRHENKKTFSGGLGEGGEKLRLFLRDNCVGNLDL